MRWYFVFDVVVNIHDTVKNIHDGVKNIHDDVENKIPQDLFSNMIASSSGFFGTKFKTGYRPEDPAGHSCGSTATGSGDYENKQK